MVGITKFYKELEMKTPNEIREAILEDYINEYMGQRITDWIKALPDSIFFGESSKQAEPVPTIQCFDSKVKEVLRIEQDGDVIWKGRKVESDSEFKAAMIDLANVMKGNMHPAQPVQPVEPVAVDHSGLIKRIDAAIERVTQGRGLMSIPADPRSDVDLVLSECKALLQGENPPFWATDFHPAQPVQPAVAQGEVVAYLDLGVGGYIDVGSDLTDEQLAALPKGRHMLAIVGTYGVDGYTEAPAAADFSDAYRGAREDAEIWKKRALEAEELNRKFIADINGHTFMGEPAQPVQAAGAQREPVAWRPMLQNPIPWVTGNPRESDTMHWASQGCEIEYAYTHPAQPVQPAGAQGGPVELVAWILFRRDEDGLEPIMFYGGDEKPDGEFKDRFVLYPVHFEGTSLIVSPPSAAINEQLLEALKKIVECDANGFPVTTFQQREEIAKAAIAEAEKAKGGV